MHDDSFHYQSVINFPLGRYNKMFQIIKIMNYATTGAIAYKIPYIRADVTRSKSHNMQKERT